MQWAAADAAWLLGAAAPFALWAAWSDLRWMKIPNLCAAGLLAAFVAVGLWRFPVELVVWHVVVGVTVLGVGFALFAIGQMGGGDAKLLAAAAPFVAPGDASTALLILAVWMLLTLLGHRLARRVITLDWVSWSSPHVPLGVGISGALLSYLALGLG